MGNQKKKRFRVWSDRFARTLSVLENTDIFRVIRRSFFIILPLILFGAFVMTIRHLPSTAGFSVNIPGLNYQRFLDNIISGTFGIVSLAVLCTFSYAMTLIANQKKKGPYISPILSIVIVMSCFFILCAPWANNTWQTVFSMGRGMLPALMIAITGSSVFLYLSRYKISRWSLNPIGHDPFVKDILTALPAGIATIFMAALFRLFIEWTGVTDFHSAVSNLAFIPFENTENGLGFGLGYTAVSQTLWSLGAHGHNLLFGVEDNILVPAVYANQAALAAGAQAGCVFTKTFFDLYTRIGGSGSTICLILAMLIKSRNRGAKKLCLFAMVPAIFNVNEPLLFGIPIVLNPVYVIPFIVTPILQALAAYLATITGIIPYTSQIITWTTPVFVSGFTCTGDLSGPMVQAVNLLIGVACYSPFVMLADTLREQRGEEMIDRLKKAASSSELKSKGIGILDIRGETGRFARALASDLTTALEKNSQLYLMYQPQVLECKHFLSGVEALLRWEHPIYGDIPPEVIVAVAQETGVVDNIGFLVLNKACRQRAAWKEITDDRFTMSVNVVPAQLKDSAFSRKVFDLLNKNGLPPEMLEIEITESSVLEPDEKTIKTLETLNKGGIRIAIDDFGMGHSSLRYLRAFPISTIKIDRSLTMGDEREINSHIVKSVLSLSQNLEISTIVEGVETHEQLDRFMDIGYMNFQGYLFSRPLTSEQCTAFILNFKKTL